jgi:hypothetical protein
VEVPGSINRAIKMEGIPSVNPTTTGSQSKTIKQSRGDLALLQPSKRLFEATLDIVESMCDIQRSGILDYYVSYIFNAHLVFT